jgi:hypothetical protein
MLRLVTVRLPPPRATLRTPLRRLLASKPPDDRAGGTAGAIARRDGTSQPAAPTPAPDGVLPEFPGRSADQLTSWRKGEFPPDMVPRELQPVRVHVTPAACVQRVATAPPPPPPPSPTRSPQTLSGRVSTLSFNLIAGLLLAGMGVLYLLLKDDDTTVQLNRLRALAEELRSARAGAAAALGAVAWDSGVIPLRRGKVLRFVAVGPPDADTVVLLHAEDFEGSPSVWGGVVAQLAAQLGIPRPPVEHETPGGGAGAASQMAEAGDGVTAEYRRRLAAVVGAPAPTSDGHASVTRAAAPAASTLAANSNPSAAVLGPASHVAAAAAQAPAAGAARTPSVRIVAFGRTAAPVAPSLAPPARAAAGAVPRGPADATPGGPGGPTQTGAAPAAAPTPGFRNTASVSLRMLDVKALWKHLYAGTGARRPSRTVLVTQGDGTWGDLALAARTGEPDVPPIHAVVAVAPTVMHRGAATVWMDAVVRQSALAAAARAAPSSAPVAVPALELLLSPPVDLDEWPEIGSLVDALRKQAIAKRGGRELTPADMRTVLQAALRVVGAQLDMLRERQAADPILSEYEAELLQQLLPTLAAASPAQGGGAGVDVRMLVPNPAALPAFVTAAQRASVGTWLMQAANAVGVAMLSPAQQEAVARARLDAAPAIAFELTGVPSPTAPLPPGSAAAGAASSTLPPPPSPSPAPAAATHIAGSAAAASAPAEEVVPRLQLSTPAPAPPALPAASSAAALPLRHPAAAFTFSLGHPAAAAASTVIATAPTLRVKEHAVDRILSQARRVLGLEGGDAAAPSFALLFMRDEAARCLPPNVLVEVAPPPSASAHGTRALAESAAGTHSARAAFQGSLATAAALDPAPTHGVVHLPLQQPGLVAAAIAQCVPR